MKLRSLFVGVALAATLAACGTASGNPGSSASPPPDDVIVVARSMAFASGQISVPADEAFTILFRNYDSAPHDIDIYADSSKSTTLFDGELITSSEVVYQIPALEPGTYFFDCSVHPSMTGSLVAE